MSRWFDILYGRDLPPSSEAPARQETPSAYATPPVGEAPAINDAQDLQPVPPLPNLPSRWALEIQKIVFHLTASEQESDPPHSIVFSGMQKQGGTTTISYLVAHHLAAEHGNQRVLFVDFSTDSKRPPQAGTMLNLRIGDPLTPEMFAASRQLLTRVSIRPGSDNSVATTSRWFRLFMATACQINPIVIIDAPPFFAASETYSVAKVCDGVVLVLKSGDTRYPALNALVADLSQLGIEVLGTVLNFRQYPIPRWLLKYI